MKDTVKATVSIKAESIAALTNALESIAERATMQIVASASVATSISIEADDASDLSDALSAIARACGLCEGIEVTAKAPMAAWDGRRLDPTPMERMINAAAQTPGEKAMDWLIAREQRGAGDENLFDEDA